MEKILKLSRPIMMITVLASSVILAVLFAPLRIIRINIDYPLMKLWAKITLWIYKIKVVKSGEDSKTPAILTTNHISYWDILTIASTYKGFFVSKASVKHWPLIGWGARFVRTIFIVREKRTSAVDVLNREAVKLIKQNDNVVMFVEGTTSANPCLPFKSGAFHMSKNTNTPIKPIAIYYSHMNFITWVGEESFVPHIMRMTYAPPINCYIFELPLMYPDEFESVNAMKNRCQTLVQEKIDYIKDNIIGENA